MSIDLTLTTFTVVEGPDNGVVRVIAGSVRYESMTFASENLPGPPGPQGAQGAQGIRGPQGPQGAQGPGQLANVKTDFGARGDGIADDTVAFQRAYEAVGNGDFAGVYAPRGIYNVGERLNCPRTCGVTPLIGDGNPVANIFLDPNQFDRGTTILWRGGGDDVVLNLDGCSGFELANFCIIGDPSHTTPPSGLLGIRLQNRPGVGAGVGIYRNISIAYCDVLYDFGSVDEGDTDHDGGNAADVTMLRCGGGKCGNGIRTSSGQNVNYDLTGVGFFGADVAINAIAGGAFCGNNVSTYDCREFLNVGQGGEFIGNSFTRMHLDGNAYRTVLYRATANASTATCDFFGVEFNGGQFSSPGPRVILKASHRVSMHGGQQLCDATGALVKFDGGGTFLGRFLRLPNDLSQIVDGDSVGGAYRLRDNYHKDTGVFLDDASGAGAMP